MLGSPVANGGSSDWCTIPEIVIEGKILSNFSTVRTHGMHKGIDISATVGSEIRSPSRARVEFSGHMRGYGNVVILNHGCYIHTLYAHNSKNYVNVGDLVKKNDVVATTGMTGNATTPHVHIEVRVFDLPIDPRPYLVVSD